MTRRFFLLVVAWIFVSCGGNTPSEPTVLPATTSTTATQTPPRPAPAPATRHIDGIVTDGDDGTPIAGATVSQPYSTPASVLTDGNGYFALTSLIARGDFGTFVSVKKPGYDDTNGWVAGQDERRQDLRLYRPRTVAAGTATRFSITEDSSMCGFDSEFRCRAVYVVVPSSGLLTIETSASDSTGPYWLAFGDVQYPFRGVTRLDSAVTAGTNLVVQVLRPWSPPPAGTVTVTTTLSN